MKLDLGSGPRKADDNREGWTRVDIRDFSGVDQVVDLTQKWPWEDDSVDEVLSAHFIEHLEPAERVHFFDELYRVLKPGAKAMIVTPFWAHERAYGDLTHKWPPVVPTFYSYLNKEWRDKNSPHSAHTCNFHCDPAGTWDNNDHWVAGRTDEVKGVLMRRYLNTTTDLIGNLVKIPPGKPSEVEAPKE